MSSFGPSPIAGDNLTQARELWKLATALGSAAPAWDATSRCGHAHIIASSALRGLSAAIVEAEGVALFPLPGSETCRFEKALLENLLELIRLRGPCEVAERLYSLADRVATGTPQL